MAVRTEEADTAVPVLGRTQIRCRSCKAGEPDRRSNFIFSPPVHQHVVCVVTYTYD